ncbi:MAG TPA: dihydropteroate synthase, partial [Acidimicrobiales bacterium]|nr:dihydropteroate synthase [Acidimicrobiales bacterium]
DSDVPVSVDTAKADVAAAALDAGAMVVNDVSAGRHDPGLFPLVADRGAGIVLMHMLGDPRTMQADPRYGDVVADVRDFLVARAEAAAALGVAEVWIDPGIGFGKTTDHNLALLAHLDLLVASGFPVVLGTSRKRFLGELLARADGRPAGELVPVGDRLAGSLATAAWAMWHGAGMVRVHDVRATVVAAETIGGR